MDIFISWSGPRSGAVAEALKKWLPKIVNAFQPWLSSADIDKGSRWSSEIAGKLATSKAGIICLTPSNLTAPWILFEAGALSKTLENTFVCPLLVGVEPRDLTGPLAQFQATKLTKDHMLPLLKTLNGALGDAAMPEIHIDEAFEVWWPILAAELETLPADGPAQQPHRTEREMLEELVDMIRGVRLHDGAILSEAAKGIDWISARLMGLEARFPPYYSQNLADLSTTPGSRIVALRDLAGTPNVQAQAANSETKATSDTLNPISKLKNRAAKVTQVTPSAFRVRELRQEAERMAAAKAAKEKATADETEKNKQK
jgi:hypothetical protein